MPINYLQVFCVEFDFDTFRENLEFYAEKSRLLNPCRIPSGDFALSKCENNFHRCDFPRRPFCVIEMFFFFDFILFRIHSFRRRSVSFYLGEGVEEVMNGSAFQVKRNGTEFDDTCRNFFEKIFTQNINAFNVD